MVQINFDATVLNRIPRMKPATGQMPAKVKSDAGSDAIELPVVQQSAKVRNSEEAQRSRESSSSKSQVHASKAPEQTRRMSTEELAEMLRKVNLTFDTFEIQAKFTIDSSNGDISVEVINLRTGEVIRKIPPYDIPKMADSLLNDKALFTDIEA
ncbi:MAG: flagellar protein FlaG [bacterium]|nr:flagellar protein FlaG [bacterium]